MFHDTIRIDGRRVVTHAKSCAERVVAMFAGLTSGFVSRRAFRHPPSIALDFGRTLTAARSPGAHA